MRGTVMFFNDLRGFGKIAPQDGSAEVFAHRTAIDGDGLKWLVEGETVDFAAEAGEHGPKATRVKRLDRCCGIVVSFEKGFGKIKPDEGGRPVFVHVNDVVGRRRKLDVDWRVEYTLTNAAKGPKAVLVAVLDGRSPLERFAELPDFEDHLAMLAGVSDNKVVVAQKENWKYRHAESSDLFPILRSFMFYTFERLQEEDKIAEATNDRGVKTACFNTGLVTERQESIYGMFVDSRREDPPWVFRAFHRESDYPLTFFKQRPEIANYFSDPAELLYDTRIELLVDKEHVIGDNKVRFPVEFQANEYALMGVLEGAVVLAKKRVRRNYKTAVPQFYRGQLQLLLPLCMRRPEQADLALVVARQGEVYRASTVLTLDMAYNNARLIARPDTEWLDP